MATFGNSTYFNAPQQQVWDVVSDWRNAEKRIEGITKIEIVGDGPIGTGTVVRETRVMFKKQHTEEMTITEWVPPSHYTMECQSCGCHYTTTVRCTPKGDGTLVEMSMDAKPLTFMAKVMNGVMGWMMSGAVKKAFAKDLEDLKRAVDGGSDPAAQPA